MNDSYQTASDLNRRQFFKGSGAALAATGILGFQQASSAAEERKKFSSRMKVTANDVILFQGDSITDAGRSRESAARANDQTALGTGYAWLAAIGLLLDRYEDHLKIYNRGISGNKVFQLAERWSEDCLDLKPNVLSILIGVNDLWHTLNGSYRGTVETYEKDYRALVEKTLAALPGVRLVICEPFVLRCGAVNDKWFPEFDRYRAAARRIAEAYRATFIPFQLMFDQAVKYAPPEHWAKDGVHPSSAGASLMAHTWLKAVNGKRPWL